MDIRSRRRSCFFLCSLFILTVTNLSFAWHQTGHMLVANVAYKNLDKSIISQLENMSNLGAAEYPMASTFVTSSVWADDIKAHGLNFFNNWHYQDALFSEDDSPLPKTYNDGQAIKMIKKFRQLLDSPDTTLIEKSFVLRLFIHLVGDIHQPLHCASRSTKLYPYGDKGGNLFKIEHPNFKNLHSLWDSGLGALDELPRPLSVKEQDWLNNYTDNLIAEYSPNSFSNSQIASSPAQWLKDGINVVKANVYTNIKMNEEPNQEYLVSNRKVVRKQIALAGYRLANELNCIFKSDKCIQ